MIPTQSLFHFLEKRFRKLVFDPGWLNERNAIVFMKSRFIKTYFISITSENLSTKLKINIVYRNLAVLTLAALVRISNGTVGSNRCSAWVTSAPSCRLRDLMLTLAPNSVQMLTLAVLTRPKMTVTSMLVTDVGDQMCWWQVWDVGDRFHTLRKSPTQRKKSLT